MSEADGAGSASAGQGANLLASIKPGPYRDMLGITIRSMEAGTAVVDLTHSPNVVNTHGSVHGGAIASLLDVVVSMAARSTDAAATGVMTVNLSINYLSPGRGDLTSTARVLSAGRNLVMVEADVTGEDGTAVAKAIATLKLIRPR